MKPRYLIILSVLLSAISACKDKPSKTYPSTITHFPDTLPDGSIITLYRSKEVSLISLIANPEKYEGKKVIVIGYLHLHFEGNGLYMHKDDYDYGINKNGIEPEVSEKHPEEGKFSKYSNHYVRLSGTFDSQYRGQSDGMSGSIKDITSIEIIPEPQEKP